MLQFKILTTGHHQDYDTVVGTINFDGDKRTLQSINYTLKITKNSDQLEMISLSNNGQFQHQHLPGESKDIKPIEKKFLCYYCLNEIAKIHKEVIKKRNIIYNYQDDYFSQFDIKELKKIFLSYYYHSKTNIVIDDIIVEIIDPKKFKAYLQNI